MFPRRSRLAGVARSTRGNDAASEVSAKRIVKLSQVAQITTPVVLGARFQKLANLYRRSGVPCGSALESNGLNTRPSLRDGLFSQVIPGVLIGVAFAILPALCQAQSYLITTSIPLASASVAADARGNLYMVAFDCVFKMNAAGILTRVAGTSQGYSGDGGPALKAQLNYPFGVAVDGSGNVFIADTGNLVVRKVAAATGIITTVAGIKPPGNGSPGYSGDGGPATSAGLSDPTAVAVDGFGNLYIADNYLVRMVSAATGIITTVAGNTTATVNSGDDGPAIAAGLGGVITGLAV
jgi:hypothetical protein